MRWLYGDIFPAFAMFSIILYVLHIEKIHYMPPCCCRLIHKGVGTARRSVSCVDILGALLLQVVVSTDVLARGVDLERVNLVINLDLPVSEGDR